MSFILGSDSTLWKELLCLFFSVALDSTLLEVATHVLASLAISEMNTGQ